MSSPVDWLSQAAKDVALALEDALQRERSRAERAEQRCRDLEATRQPDHCVAEAELRACAAVRAELEGYRDAEVQLQREREWICREQYATREARLECAAVLEREACVALVKNHAEESRVVEHDQAMRAVAETMAADRRELELRIRHEMKLESDLRIREMVAQAEARYAEKAGAEATALVAHALEEQRAALEAEHRAVLEATEAALASRHAEELRSRDAAAERREAVIRSDERAMRSDRHEAEKRFAEMEALAKLASCRAALAASQRNAAMRDAADRKARALRREQERIRRIRDNEASAKAKAEVAETSKQIADLERELQRERILRSALQGASEGSETKVTAMEAQLDTLRNQLQNGQASWEDEARRARVEYRDLRSECDGLKLEALHAKARSEAQIAAVEADVQRARRSEQSAQAECERLGRELKVIKESEVKLREDFAAARGRAMDLEQEIVVCRKLQQEERIRFEADVRAQVESRERITASVMIPKSISTQTREPMGACLM